MHNQPVQYGGPPATNPSFVPGAAPPAQGAPPPQGYPGQGQPPPAQAYPQQPQPVAMGQPVQTGQYPQQYPQPVHQAPVYVISGRNPEWQVHFSNPPPQINQWKYGMCDCCQDTGLCCDVFWCEPCMLSRLHPAIEDGLSDTFSCPVCALLCGAWALIGGLACCLHVWYLRDRTRMAFGVRGDACADCCVACWCGPCAMCQMHRELRSRGVDPGVTCCQSSTPVQRQAAVAQPGFVMHK